MPPTPDKTSPIAAPLSPDVDFFFPMDIPPHALGIASKSEKGLSRSKSRSSKAVPRINSRPITVTDFLEALHIDTPFVRTPSVKSIASLVDPEEAAPRSPSSDIFMSQLPYEPNLTFSEAWICLRESIVKFAGEPVGTIAALDPSEETLNYNQVPHCPELSGHPVRMRFYRQGGAHLVARCDWEFLMNPCWSLPTPLLTTSIGGVWNLACQKLGDI